jgi:hypothetical protein
MGQLVPGRFYFIYGAFSVTQGRRDIIKCSWHGECPITIDPNDFLAVADMLLLYDTKIS